jgi:YidC/Oxa1 family membrane protein insertase
MTDQKNTILAIVLSALVLIGWQVFFGLPQMQKQQDVNKQTQTQQTAQPQSPQSPQSTVPTPAQPASGAAPTQLPGQAAAAPTLSREAALKQSPRITIETPRINGSIALKGGRLDDVALSLFHETVDPASAPIELLSPSGSQHPFYAEFGWVGAANSGLKLPNAETLWQQVGTGALTPTHPVTLAWDNGEGLEFRRTVAVDEKYLFTIKDEVVNKGTAAIALHPYGLISRHGTPATLGYYILHEGAVGYLGDKGLQEVTYKNLEEKKTISFDVTNAWFGITDKYWAATLLPDTKAKLQANFSATAAGQARSYQTDYLLEPMTIQPGATGAVEGRLFAGAKEVSVVDGYNKQLDVNHFDLLIDWGWFYFITKPLFTLMDWIYRLVGNFGIAILLVTVIIKGVFFPLANKSYASMAKMKAMQPHMQALRLRYPDDKVKQQQELMELYRREKINPVAGCLPIVVQIPVFFALYKVLFVTIEMRHAPFFGWIRDLSAPDPTNIFTLLGYLNYDPTIIPVVGQFLHLGIWPLIMGVTMWVQMKLNPAPPDPTQKLIFDWMPIVFTFMLANFSAGLVIYWAWNNTLSVIQQSIIMRKNGVKVELFDNLKGLLSKKDRDKDKK